jgi:hypothetical protein
MHRGGHDDLLKSTQGRAQSKNVLFCTKRPALAKDGNHKSAGNLLRMLPRRDSRPAVPSCEPFLHILDAGPRKAIGVRRRERRLLGSLVIASLTARLAVQQAVIAKADINERLAEAAKLFAFAACFRLVTLHAAIFRGSGSSAHGNEFIVLKWNSKNDLSND